MKRAYFYKFKHNILLFKMINYTIFKSVILINSLYFNNKIKETEIMHLFSSLRYDFGLTSLFSIIVSFFKLEINSNFKILDESLVEDKKNHLKVSYALRSLLHKGQRILISIYKNENGKVSISNREAIPSLTKIYKSANWLERENFDLFGLLYKNHKDLRRILTDYGFVGAPFRKDFPLIGYKELSYNSEIGSVNYKKISLLQEYRQFDMVNPWEK